MNWTHHRGLAAFALFGLAIGIASAQPGDDPQAESLLNIANKAYADANYPFAAEEFREFLAKFGTHKKANAARYGLGLALLDLPDRDYAKALETLIIASNDPKFPERALALYYAGVSRRGLGQKEMADGAARPNEMPQRQQAANNHFGEACRLFIRAREAFEKKPADAEWAARARCDQAEMEIRLGKAKEARSSTEPFVKSAPFEKSQYRPMGLYYHGFACYLLNDLAPAGKSLNQLAPFDQPFGLHARYLMGRIHHREGEKAEAASAFAVVLTDYEHAKKAAGEALKQPDKFKNDPWEKSRLEALVKGPAPDFVAGAAFHAACLNYEAGKFGEALPKFQAFAKEYANCSLKDDALLRAGFCLVQSKSFDDAAKTLQRLTAHPKLGYQAMCWLGKAQLGKALATDPNNPNARRQAFSAAINSLKDAAFKSGQLAAQGDADAKLQRQEILLEQADAMLAAGQAPLAAQLYDQLANENLLPAKAEEVLQRCVAAYHLAGDVNKSEAGVASFKRQFPNSPLLPWVFFHSAENSFVRAEQLAKQNNAAGAKQAYNEAATRYENVAKQFPEFERVNRARYGLALCLTAEGEWEKAAAVLETIPAAERMNDLAPVAYVLADCLIRLTPAKAEDALADNMLREKLATAASLLDGFIAANPKAAETPDALLKLALCHKRLGVQLAPGNERNDAFNKSRAALERLQREFPQSPLIGAAHLQRAKVLALQGDKGSAINVLRQFASDPLQQSPEAPLALISLATLLREEKQGPAAADMLKQARDRFEAALNRDPKRSEWVSLLRYHHGMALFESGKIAEARTAFEQAAQAGGVKPIGVEASLKGLQCSVDDTKKKIEAIEKEKQKPNLNPHQISDLDNRIKVTRGELANYGRQLEQKAEHYKAALPQSDARARMLYDAAWALRGAGTDAVPVYTKLISEFADLSLSIEARLELAELQADTKMPDAAIKLLREAIDKEPTDQPTRPETLERIRLRLGGILFDKADFEGARGQFDAIAANEKSPHRGQALCRSAECLLAQGKLEEAKNKLVIFRDNGAFHNIAGVSDRAVLRLGHTLLALKQWDPARQAFETVINRYGNNNSWAIDARYGMGLALQGHLRFDDAVNAYVQVIQMTQDDRAGRARLQIGECRAKQNRWADAGKELQRVYYAYDIPELKFTAMIEHARVLVEEKKPGDARKLLEKVVQDAPKDSEWAKAAQVRLGKIKQ